MKTKLDKIWQLTLQQVDEGNIIEFLYSFKPSSELQALINTMPSDAALLYDEMASDNHVKFQVLPIEKVGFRVNLEGTYLYLKVGDIKEEDFPEIIKLHTQLLDAKIYYLNEEDVLDYWKKPEDTYNKAEDYADQSLLVRSHYLLDIINRYCPDIESAFEIGCNVGRNMAYLKQNKDIIVAGAEISEHAITLMKTIFYPELLDSKIYIADAREAVKGIPDKSYDLVFSMAVLMHMHPLTEETFWENIVRIAKKYIITIEDESSASPRNWARNYDQIFSKFDATLIFTETQLEDQDQALLYGYTTRVFKVSAVARKS